MSQRDREYYLQLVNTRTKKPINDDSGDFQVYQPGTPVRQTIRSVAGATLTQEVVGTSYISRDMTDGQIHFFTNLSASLVDISVLTAGGRAYFLKGVTPSQHRIDVDPEKSEYILTVAINEKHSHTTVVPVGFRLRKGMIVSDVFVKVVTAWNGSAVASNMENVGRSGDRDGLLDGIHLSSAGYKQAAPVVSTTGVVTANRYGVDLAKFHASSTAFVDFYIRKVYFAQTAVVSNNLTISRVTATTHTGASFTVAAGKGYVFFVYRLSPLEANED